MTAETIVDLGANWRHADQGNPLNQFFNNSKYNLSLVLDDTEEKLKTDALQFTKRDGSRYSQEEVFGELIEQYVYMLKGCGNLAKSNYQDFSQIESITDLIDFYCTKTNNQAIKDELLLTAALCTCSNYPNDLSDLPFSLIKAPDGSFPFIKVNKNKYPITLGEHTVGGRKDHLVLGGYSKVIDGIVEQINQQYPGKLTILTNSAITQIDYTDPNLVHVAVGDTIYSSKTGVIYTLPIGVMQDVVKTQPDFFVPDLPADKKQAILRARQGTTNKVIIKFKEPIMDTSLASFFAAQNEQSAAICPTQWINFAYYDHDNMHNDNTTIMGLG